MQEIQMIGIAVCTLSILGLIWEFMILPKFMERKIKELANIVNAEVVNMELVSRIKGMYLVDVQDSKESVKMNAKYNILGKVEWVKA